MKKLLLITASLMTFLGNITYAEESNTPVLASSIEVAQVPIVDDRIRADILAKYAEEKQWCQQSVGTSKPGAIVIEWTTDAKGQCTKQVVRVVK